jgi:hypothetical protein
VKKRSLHITLAVLGTVIIMFAFVFSTFDSVSKREEMLKNYKPEVPNKIIKNVRVFMDEDAYTYKFYYFDEKTGKLTYTSSAMEKVGGYTYSHLVKNDCPQDSLPFVEYFNTPDEKPYLAIIHVRSLDDLEIH